MKRSTRSVGALTVLTLLFAACGKADTPSESSVTGGISAVMSIDKVLNTADTSVHALRSAALLGVQVAEYISMTPTVVVASGIAGVEVTSLMHSAESTITDPDFKLLAAFSEALSVDVAELLNRSQDRREQLDVYAEALTNVATRANDRYKELRSIEEQATTDLRSLKKELSTAEREVKNATSEKDFSLASEKQKIVLDLQKQIADKELQVDQTSDIVDQLADMLELYGEKILAIQRNREALILGVQVIDVPGVEELQLIKREKTTRRTNRQGLFDGLF